MESLFKKWLNYMSTDVVPFYYFFGHNIKQFILPWSLLKITLCSYRKYVLEFVFLYVSAFDNILKRV